MSASSAMPVKLTIRETVAADPHATAGPPGDG
jgi:hypothetical protein